MFYNRKTYVVEEGGMEEEIKVRKFWKIQQLQSASVASRNIFEKKHDVTVYDSQNLTRFLKDF